jgi:glycosyltransferase involved in cell wall biosynthesis
MSHQNEKSKIIAVHLLNDFSGSPFVFSQALQVMLDDGLEVHLFTSPGAKGFLSDLKLNQHRIPYKWNKHKIITFIYFLLCQCIIFFKILRICRQQDIVYINTMLPCGAALAGRLRGSKVIYHIHEVSVRPLILKKALLSCIRNTADYCIFVSAYVKENTNTGVPGVVIYNSLPESFIRTAEENSGSKPKPFTVLMLCSLKAYKGVFQFIECARRLPLFRFRLVLNAQQAEIDLFFKNTGLPQNLQMYPAQSDVHPFYAGASIVMNLSQPGQWIETFGMTALEGMYYRRPVIVPAAGGIMELVRDQVCGYTVDAGNVDEVTEKISFLATNDTAYENMSAAAYVRAARFTPSIFKSAINRLFQQVMADEHMMDFQKEIRNYNL